MKHSFRLSIYFDFDRFHRFISEDRSVHQKMKTEFMQTANLLTIELQLRVKGPETFIIGQVCSLCRRSG